jgi:hypothetical protein
MLGKGRHGIRAVRRDLRGMTPDQRKIALDWCEAIEHRIKEFSLPAPLSMEVESISIKAILGMDADHPHIVPVSIAVNMGYASRMVTRESLDGAPWTDPALDEILLRDSTGHPDLEASAEDGDCKIALFRYVGGLATDSDRFEGALGFAGAFWMALASIAASRLHANMKSQRIGRVEDLPAETIEGLMRLGFLLRCIDEAIGAEPRPSGT